MEIFKKHLQAMDFESILQFFSHITKESGIKREKLVIILPFNKRNNPN